MNYVVYNIEDELLDSYQSKYYKYDIMQPLNLPQQFLGRKLITSSEITAVSPIRASGFGEFLAGNNADSLCTLYLSSSDAALATLAVSHKAGRGDFSFEEQRMLKQICEITSLHYQQAVRAQQKKVRNSLFELGVNSLCDSYIILNQDLQVMERSSEAEAYCKIFYEKYFITFSSSLSSRVSFCQKTVDFLGKDFFDENCVKSFETGNTKYTFLAQHLQKTDCLELEKQNFYILFIKAFSCSSLLISSDVLANVHILSKREKEIVLHLAQGDTNSQMARELYISPHTIRTHISNIYKKLDVSNRIELISKLNSLK